MYKKIFSAILFLIFTICPLYAQEKIEYQNDEAGIHIFKINTKKFGAKIRPYQVKSPITSQKLFEDKDLEFVVNGGFFDVKTGKSVSYVVIDNKMVSNVEYNIQLMEQLRKQDRFDKVLSRSEFRILENKRHKLKFDIAYHNAPIQKGYKIKHSLQAGPMLLPEMDLVKEGFVIIDDDMIKMQSVDILKRRERTVLGLKGKYLYVVLFDKNHKVDANEMREYMTKKLKVKKSMALDGGLSTSVNYRDISIGSFNNYQRKVKTFLVVEK